ncbi:hypothetical protein M5215_004285 [Vibrio vulnificus]|nr:hypothetical protein [Vibrio vulnificus]EHI9279492.1 hypothetical protein [Vibrio vulnificus]EJE8535900.1 hypothetical protein [Vibrio vulnificus]EJE8540517.1 hypothetical protein [Vibrio vulnificus]EKA7343339.1 hypothetical protein [Vibrio vulnificus]
MNNQLSKEYVIARQELENTLKITQEFSIKNSSKVAVHSVDWVLSALFVRMCTTARTILLSSPRSKCTSEVWDYASHGTLLRNVIDALNSFMYLAQSGISENEKNCRFLLFSLHDAVTRKKIFEFRGSLEEAKLCSEREDEVKQDLKANSFFMDLPEKKQKHYLKGTDPFLLSKEEIIEAYGGAREDFLGLYKFLSANAHSFPMGYFKMSENDFGKGLHSQIEEEYTAMILQLTSSHLNVAKQVYANYQEQT